jgi:hypothetical protein
MSNAINKLKEPSSPFQSDDSLNWVNVVEATNQKKVVKKNDKLKNEF